MLENLGQRFMTELQIPEVGTTLSPALPWFRVCKHLLTLICLCCRPERSTVSRWPLKTFTQVQQAPHSPASVHTSMNHNHGFQPGAWVFAEMYSLLLETYIKDPQEKSRLFHAIDNIPAIQRKAEWAMKWIQR